MIKWLTGTRHKAQPEAPTSLTNDPLAAISFFSGNGIPRVYAVSRVNPLFKEENSCVKEFKESPGRRVSLGKSTSSGYDSKGNSSSEYGSGNEASDGKHSPLASTSVKRERRSNKFVKSNGQEGDGAEKKKGLEGNAAGKKKGIENAEERKENDCDFNDQADTIFKNLLATTLSQYSRSKSKKLKNGSPSGTSNLTPIPEGKVDCSIPRPIWPRLDDLPGGTTDRTESFYLQRNSDCDFEDTSRHEYEHSWEEFSRLHCNYDDCPSSDGVDNSGKSSDSGKGSQNSVDVDQLTQDLLKELFNVISQALLNKDPSTMESILQDLSETIKKSLGSLHENGLLKIFLKNLSQIRHLNSCNIYSHSNSVDHIYEKAARLSPEGSNYDPYYLESPKIKDGIYSSETDSKEGIYISSCSSGGKDIYTSEGSSTVEKDGVYSGSSSESTSTRPPLYLRTKSEDSLRNEKFRRKDKKIEKNEKISRRNIKSRIMNRSADGIYHQRESSTSSLESSSGVSDLIPAKVQVKEKPETESKRIQLVGPTEVLVVNNSVNNCGSSAYEKLISAKRKISGEEDVVGEQLIGLDNHGFEGGSKVENVSLQKVEHPYYVEMGRPDFTLDLPQAERLMKKIASSKQQRCWCRMVTSSFALIFFLFTVMMVSLVITKGRRMFGAI